ncbi:MAG: hypothetical protein KC586_08880 [Myxococcales bacterium]|nr:hypothetical protein [Myxococcales bacterium]
MANRWIRACGLGVALFFGCGDDDGGVEDDAGRGDAGAVDAGARVDASVGDAEVPDGHVGGALGATCDDASACASGACVDGVCCENACEGSCASCLGEVTGGDDGRCLPVREGVDPDDECADGPCQTGSCDGAGACGARPDGEVCRASAGDCDVAEVCDAGACPSDEFAGEGTTCRASAGVCDVEEVCDGSGPSCPVDAFNTPGATCRASTGACDVAELCDGTSAACPSDVVASSGTSCRPSAGPCDVAEVCDGTSTACPAEVFLPAETVCRPRSGPCDATDECTGASAGCPIRYYTGPQDACGPYLCRGAGTACPTSCTTDADCGGTTFCFENTCTTGKRLFVTNQFFTANFGNLGVADMRCQAAAEAAGLPGTFKAWLSDSEVSMAARSTHATVPYYTLGTTERRVLARDWADLIDGITLAPVYTETGAIAPGASGRTWTATDADGTGRGPSCNDWTSTSSGVTATTGYATAAGRVGVANWSTYGSPVACNNSFRLYCLEQ